MVDQSKGKGLGTSKTTTGAASNEGRMTGSSRVSVAADIAEDDSIASDAHMNSITNAELVKQFPEQIKSGRVFVFFQKDAKNGWVDSYFAQAREVQAPKNLSRDLPALSAFELAMKGWDGPSIVRHRDVGLAERLQSMGITEGQLLPEGIAIAQVDTINYPDQVRALNPRQNNEGFVLVDVDGNPIYRQTSLVEVSDNIELDVLYPFQVSNVTVDEHVERMEAQFEREAAAEQTA